MVITRSTRPEEWIQLKKSHQSVLCRNISCMFVSEILCNTSNNTFLLNCQCVMTGKALRLKGMKSVHMIGHHSRQHVHLMYDDVFSLISPCILVRHRCTGCTWLQSVLRCCVHKKSFELKWWVEWTYCWEFTRLIKLSFLKQHDQHITVTHFPACIGKRAWSQESPHYCSMKKTYDGNLLWGFDICKMRRSCDNLQPKLTELQTGLLNCDYILI